MTDASARARVAEYLTDVLSVFPGDTELQSGLGHAEPGDHVDDSESFALEPCDGNLAHNSGPVRIQGLYHLTGGQQPYPISDYVGRAKQYLHDHGFTQTGKDDATVTTWTSGDQYRVGVGDHLDGQTSPPVGTPDALFLTAVSPCFNEPVPGDPKDGSYWERQPKLPDVIKHP